VHSFEFFRRLGFYCSPEFLGQDTRGALLSQIQASVPVPAEVFDGGPDPVVDMAVRNTWEVPVGGAAELGGRLGALRAELADHFKLPLDGHEGPTCLMYQPGGFYEPHVDRSSNEAVQISAARRRVSVVIFLNAMRTPPGRDDYSGGALTFYGVVDDPAWRRFGFGLAPEPGLLVAFPSHVVHEVTPVTAGDRYTIVDWFTG
jgi:predicted 2-oxoglutarate/Fe(II)-dependent dioxygenase YbiX